MGPRTRRTWRVLFVGTGGTSNASARSRVFCYLKLLRERGIRSHVTSYVYHKHLRRPGWCGKLWLELLPLRNALEFLRADTIYFHRLNYSRGLVNMARLMGKRVVHDFDDAVYLYTPDSADYRSAEANRERQKRLDWILHRVNAVIVSGEELRTYAASRAQRVHVIPSVVPEAVEAPSRGHNPPVIGWVGAPENQRYLKQVEPAILQLQAENPGLDVWLITRELLDPPPRFRHSFIKWGLEAENEFIPQCTVGIAPLDDDPWCRAKMNFKALVYLSHGVPAVVTPGGFPLSEFEPGLSILVATSQEEWYHCLKDVLTSSARRQNLAAGGLDVVRRKFVPEAWAAKLAEVLVGP